MSNKTNLELLQEKIAESSKNGLIDIKITLMECEGHATAELIAGEILDILAADERGECTDYTDY